MVIENGNDDVHSEVCLTRNIDDLTTQGTHVARGGEALRPFSALS